MHWQVEQTPALSERSQCPNAHFALFLCGGGCSHVEMIPVLMLLGKFLSGAPMIMF